MAHRHTGGGSAQPSALAVLLALIISVLGGGRAGASDRRIERDATEPARIAASAQATAAVYDTTASSTVATVRGIAPQRSQHRAVRVASCRMIPTLLLGSAHGPRAP